MCISRRGKHELSALGSTIRLTAEVRSQYGQLMPPEVVNWLSDSPRVASVDASGLVTAIANGTAMVQASAGTVSRSAKVAVAQVTAKLVLEPHLDTLLTGDTLRLAAEAFDANGHAIPWAAIAWTSQDPRIAEVDASGLVTAVAVGMVVVEASTASGVTGGAEIEVVLPVLVPSAVSVTPDSVVFEALGQTQRLSAEVFDQFGSVMEGAVVAWTSGDTTVAVVDSAGVVTAVSEGTAAVTAAAGAVSGTATVTVAQVVASVAVTPPPAAVVEADTLRLAAVAADANGHEVTGTAIAWVSADTRVAVVDGEGLVTGVAAGTVVVEATVAGVTGGAEIEVVPPVPSSVSVTPDSVVFTALGDSERLSAEVFDQGGRVMEGAAVSWSSGDTAVSVVDGGGRVTAAGEGETVLTVDAGGATAAAVVKVDQVVVSAVVTPPVDTVAMGDTLRLVAEALDANGHWILRLANAFSWTSSDTAIARVEGFGLVTGESEGTATIAAWAGGVRASAEVTVVNPDRAVLLALYEETGGPNWSRSDNWLTDAPLGEWYGVRADDYGRVVSLHPSNPAMSGPIPPELGDLTRLEHLILQRTSLSGSVPAELGRLKNLKTLRLSGSLLTGPIPSELGALSALRTLDLGYNDLTGSIPAELGNLAALRILSLAGNRLSGEIPDELGNFASLIALQLQDNDLTGHLPATLGNLGELLHLSVNGNPLTGALPATFRRLGNLRILVAHNTELCAPRPLWNWGYSSIEVFRVPQPCPDGTGTAYLVQSVQDLKGSVPLVAGRDALLRVFLTAPVRNGERVPIPPVQARFFANGREIYLAEIPGKAGPLPTDTAIAEGDLETSANVRIPGHVIQPGLLEVMVEVDPAGTVDPWFGVVRALPEVYRPEVLDPPAMELTIVPFLWTGDPDSSIIDITRAMAADPDSHETLSLTREVLPISDWRVRAHEPVWTDSRDAWDLMNRARAIRALEGGRGYWMATLKNNLPADIAGVAGVGRWASFARPSSPYIAHELGHNMSLWHAPCGGPQRVDPAYPYPDGTIGMWGYSTRRERLVSPDTRDLMGYCWNRWISGYHFRNALAHRLRVESLGDRCLSRADPHADAVGRRERERWPVP